MPWLSAPMMNDPLCGSVVPRADTISTLAHPGDPGRAEARAGAGGGAGAAPAALLAGGGGGGGRAVVDSVVVVSSVPGGSVAAGPVPSVSTMPPPGRVDGVWVAAPSSIPAAHPAIAANA